MAPFLPAAISPNRAARRRAGRAGLVLALGMAASSCNMLPKVTDSRTEPASGPASPASTQAANTAVGPVKPANLLPPPPGRPAPNPAEAAAGADSARESVRTYPGTGVFVNQKPPAPPRASGPEEASLNFEGLDVREVAKVILGDYLKESYTVHPGVSGTVTFRTIRPIPLRDLLPTLEMLLRQNGAAVVREEGIYKILPIAQVRGSVSPQLGGPSLPIPQGFSVMVVPLKFVGATHMQKLLEPFAADNTIRVDEVRNLVIIAGNQREMRHLLDTIELFDVDWLAGYSVGIFPIRSADVKTLMTDLDKVFGATATGPLAGAVRIIPIERLNALLMVTTQPRYLETARSWVEKLDQMGGGAGGARFYVYQVRNGRAENLATLISDLFSSRRTTTTAAPGLAPGARPAEIRSPGFGGAPATGTTVTTTNAPASATFNLSGTGGTTSSEVRVIADKDTNSLLILATPADYDVVEGALRKLDVMRRQVLVEVMLAEVTLTDDMSLGIDWFLDLKNNTTGTLNLGSLPTTPGGDPGVFSQGLQLIQRTALGANADIRAVLRARGEDGKVKVLASPQIMVLDNEKAEIKVGDRISVQTQSQTAVGNTGQLVNSFQYLETGILLAVTPRINSGGLVTLEVSQEVSAPSTDATSAANPNPNVSSRNAKTSVVVASGEPIVMAGLIRENTSRGTAGLPLLSKIPILGAAFGRQTWSRDRTELVLIITPRIISDTVQAREATEELRKRLPSLEGMLPKLDKPPVDARKP